MRRVVAAVAAVAAVVCVASAVQLRRGDVADGEEVGRWIAEWMGGGDAGVGTDSGWVLDDVIRQVDGQCTLGDETTAIRCTEDFARESCGSCQPDVFDASRCCSAHEDFAQCLTDFLSDCPDTSDGSLERVRDAIELLSDNPCNAGVAPEVLIPNATSCASPPGGGGGGGPSASPVPTPTPAPQSTPPPIPSASPVPTPTPAPQSTPPPIPPSSPTPAPSGQAPPPIVAPGESATSPPTPPPVTDAGGDDGGSSRVCFPAHATVQLHNGHTKPISSLQPGDRVRTSSHTYSDVFAFTHRDAHATASFVRIETDSHAIELSGSHYLPVNGRVVSAERVAVGDHVELGEGGVGVVKGVRRVSGVGLYNPQTMDGRIVVDGIVATCYTRAVDPRLADVLLAVPRMLYRLGVKEPLGSVLYGSVGESVGVRILSGEPVI